MASTTRAAHMDPPPAKVTGVFFEYLINSSNVLTGASFRPNRTRSWGIKLPRRPIFSPAMGLCSSCVPAAVDVLQLTKVYPSAGPSSTLLRALKPPAPGLFSTMTFCPKNFSILSANSLEHTSVMPPGPKPTIKVMGLSGNPAAPAGNACQTITENNRTEIKMNRLLMVKPPLLGLKVNKTPHAARHHFGFPLSPPFWR